MKALRDRVWAYQGLSRWTDHALAEGIKTAGKTHSGAPLSYLGYSNDDVLISAGEWKEATANLCSAMATVSAATASVFKIHWSAIEARYAPSTWPALRTYDIRVRLIHVGDSVRCVVAELAPMIR